MVILFCCLFTLFTDRKLEEEKRRFSAFYMEFVANLCSLDKVGVDLVAKSLINMKSSSLLGGGVGKQADFCNLNKDSL